MTIYGTWIVSDVIRAALLGIGTQTWRYWKTDLLFVIIVSVLTQSATPRLKISSSSHVTRKIGSSHATRMTKASYIACSIFKCRDCKQTIHGPKKLDSTFRDILCTACYEARTCFIFVCCICKQEIHDLKYSRTSQGIFCLGCHEDPMRRKAKKIVSANDNDNEQGTEGERQVAKTDNASPTSPTPPTDALISIPHESKSALPVNLWCA